MNRKARTLAYVMTGAVTIGLGAALATSAFAAETGPVPDPIQSWSTAPLPARSSGESEFPADPKATTGVPQLETNTSPAPSIEAPTSRGPGPIEHRADGWIVVRSTLPVAIEANAPVTHQKDGSLLVAPGTPVELLPNGGVRIG